MADQEQWLQWVRWLDDCRDEMITTVVELADINSGTLNLPGLATVQQRLIELYSVLQGELSVHATEPLPHIDSHGRLVHQPLGSIVHWTKRPAVRPRVILCIHMDTVYGLDHAFQQCRWLGPHTLNGPGVIDAKGGLVVMLYALRALERSPLAGQIGWEVIINPDEELGSPGSFSFLTERAQQADVGMLFEPTMPDGSLIGWRKGTGNFTFVVHGRSAHSGRDFANGRNAIVALARMIDEIDRCNGHPDITYNVGRVEGGGALNMVPELAIGRVNVRVATTEQQEEVEQHFAEIVARTNQLDGIKVAQHGAFYSPPKPLDEPTQQLQRRIEQCAALLDIPVSWVGSGGSSDGNKFHAAGLPNVDSLGPVGGALHSSDEYLIADSLVPRAKLAALVLFSLAMQPLFGQAH